MYGGPHISDEELMFRVEVDDETRRKLLPPTEYKVWESPVTLLSSALARAGGYRHIQLTKPDMSLTMGRTRRGGGAEA